MGRPSVREQLVAASLGVFQAHGFNGSSVQDLTDAAGVPKGSFYNHFKSKEDLALEALKLYLECSGAEILRDERLEPLDRLKRHFRANWKTAKDRGYTAGCFLGTMASEIADTHEKSRAAFLNVFQVWSVLIERAIKEAQERGEVAKDRDPALLSRFVLNAWQGTLVRMKVVKGEGPLKDFISMVFDVLLK
ncbi:TetR/AcrR family transcriptional regulator [Variovorax atrisoli]|uniref:TetR/AcrR family transcriptional regulator n=1 Tax=Variovorax atrisoli TaxID=3394203 RepID=UPI000477E98E